MKRKKIFAGLLVGILCACALPILTFAEGETWTDLDLSAVTENGCTLTSGNYRLVEDIRITNSITVPNKEEVTLDLNGYTITETENVPVIEISGDKSSLTLLDSSETQTGTITGGKGTSNQGGGVHNEGTFLMEGGNITGNDAGSGSGGGVYVASSGKFTMNGGVIAGNSYSEISNGGGVCVAKGGEFTMNGGTISANETERYGGGVYVASSGKFTMNGGAITDNTIVFGNNQYSGGGIYNAGTFTMTGGIIAENKCLNNGYGGGVYNDYGTFTMTGGTITGNQATSGGGIYNCNLDSSVTLSPTNADISIYANNATTAPDIYNASGGYLTLSADVNQNLPDYDFLGWYDDNTDQAYTPTKKDKSKLYLEAKLHQHTVVYIEAVDATCTEEGNIGYWQCSDCGACFGVTEDGGVGEIITEEDIILDALGHSLEKVAAIEPTCESEGNIGYWRCTRCGKYFADENGENEITEEDIIIDALGHALETIAEIEPTCTEEGNIEYRRCARCGKYFADENGENEITEEDIIIDALGHALDTIAEIEPTCTSEGNIGYWRCARCGKYFADEKGENEITEEDIIIDALGHELEKIAAIEPTCTSEGNIGYWRCERCGKCFADEKGENEIAEEEFVLDALGHALEKVAAIEPTCESEGNIGYWRCTRCGKYFADEKGENEITEEDIIIDALGHDFTFEDDDNYNCPDYMEYVAEVTQTCSTSGCKAYFHCTQCDKYFLVDGNETTLEALQKGDIDPNNHAELIYVPATAAIYESAGNIEYWYCEECGKYFADKEATIEITYSDTVIPMLTEPGVSETTEVVTDTTETVPETTESTAGMTETSETVPETTESTAGMTDTTETVPETTESTAGVTETSETAPDTTESTAGVTETSETVPEATESTAGVTDTTETVPDTTESTADVTDTTETVPDTTESTAGVTDTTETVPDTTESTAGVTETSETVPETTESTAGVTDTSETVPDTTESTAGVTDTTETVPDTTESAGVTDTTKAVPETTESTAGVTDTTEAVPDTTESTAGVTDTTEAVPDTTESTAGVTDTTETVPETTESAGVTEESESSTISSLPGDVDFDGEVTPTDSYLCLVAYARAQLGFDSELNELQQFVADVNFDGIVDPTDAYYILVYYATEQIRGAITWEEIIDAWEHTPIA